MCASTTLKEIVSAITILVEAAVMFVVAILVSEAPVVITRLLDNGNVCRQVNQVKLCGTVCVKKLLPLDEFQCARCIMLIMKVEIVVGGEASPSTKDVPSHSTSFSMLIIHRWFVCVIGPEEKITD